MTARKPSPGLADGLTASISEPVMPEYVYLGRQPILDRNGALSAFELLFRSGAANFAQITDDAEAIAQVIARLIGDMGLSAGWAIMRAM